MFQRLHQILLPLLMGRGAFESRILDSATFIEVADNE
jgi:hypothetical protein